MPINNNYFISFDFETTGLDTSYHEPLEIGALVIDPRTLEVVPGGQFLSDIAPTIPLDKIEPKALEVNGFTIDRIKAAPPQEQVWKMFQKFVSKYNVKGFGGYPIAMGANIKCYDLPIAARLCHKYGMVDKDGNPKLFNRKYIFDIYEILLPYFESNTDLDSYKMDSLRDYFGISKDGAHTALKDCVDCAKIITRFLKFSRNNAKRQQFRDSFKGL